jgi:LmbE family N-acetylglucosaminyl deacetylase
MGDAVFAIGCHPDDIEFMMAGTLFLLKDAGCELHYANLANGECGSARYPRRRISRMRRRESIAASDYLGAAYHGSIARDLQVFYRDALIRRVAAMIREVSPAIVLAPSIEDYMEDHMSTARIVATAAFARGMPNYRTIPARRAVSGDVALYHALPYGLRDAMGSKIRASMYVDVGAAMDRKARMISFHESQRAWLDASQRIDSYTESMTSMSLEMGRDSGKFEYAEGWRQHGRLGFSAEGFDPLGGILGRRASLIAGIA